MEGCEIGWETQYGKATDYPRVKLQIFNTVTNAIFVNETAVAIDLFMTFASVCKIRKDITELMKIATKDLFLTSNPNKPAACWHGSHSLKPQYIWLWFSFKTGKDLWQLLIQSVEYYSKLSFRESSS